MAASTAPAVHVRDSVKQIDATSWLIGSTHILRHFQGPREGGCLWENAQDGSYYTLSAAPGLQLDAGPLFPDGHARQIHDAGDSSAVFGFGDSLIIKIRNACDNTRREPETLAFLAKEELSFDVPVVLFYTEEEGKTYLVEPYIPGKRLNEAWWDMTEEEKEHVVSRVSEACAEIKVFQSNAMTASDCNWMNPFSNSHEDRAEVLQRQCEALGMDCSAFVLSHNDLGPTNIIVNGDRVVIIDWEMAGYAPLAWVRTKFAICRALNAERISPASEEEVKQGIKRRVERDQEYRERVERRLGEMGFPEVTVAYQEARDASSEKAEGPKRAQRLFIQMSGAPGSGKSTMAKLLQQSIGGVVIDHDVIRSSLLQDNDLPFDEVAKQAYRLQWASASEVAQQGSNVIVDSTCNFQEVLDQGSALAEQHGLAYWYVECRVEDIDLLDQRLRARTPMTSQRTGVDRPPEAASAARQGEDSHALFQKWINSPCRPGRNAIVVDSTGDLESGRNRILEHILSCVILPLLVCDYTSRPRRLTISQKRQQNCHLATDEPCQRNRSRAYLVSQRVRRRMMVPFMNEQVQ